MHNTTRIKRLTHRIECGVLPGKSRLRAPLLGLLLLATPVIGGHAAPTTDYTWKNVTVGAGGFAPNIIFSRVEKDLAYLRTDMGGAYRWDQPGQRFRTLAGDLQHDGRVYVATDGRGIVYGEPVSQNP